MKHLAIITLLTITLCVGCEPTEQQIESKLTDAIIRGDLEKAQTTLNRSNGPAALATQHLHTAMNFSGRQEKGEMFKLLVNNGGDLNDQSRGTPVVIHELVFGGMTPELLQWCIDKGFDVNLTDKQGRSALSVCFEQAAFDPDKTCKIVKILIDNGAQVKNTSSDQFLLYRLITTGGDTQPKRRELLQLLLAAGVDIEVKNSRSKTALLLAIEFGQNEFAKILIEHGANPNVADEHGNTVLFKAVNGGDTNCVERLIAAGADVNAVNSLNDTPLWWALNRSDTIDIVELLLAAGANPNHIKKGKTVLDSIDKMNTCQPTAQQEANKQKLIQLLTQYGGKIAAELEDTNA